MPPKEQTDVSREAHSDANEALEYTRRLFAHIIEWYSNADTKSHILLTIDGVFLAFLTSSILIDPDDLTQITGRFRTVTWVLLILMCLTLTGSIVSALMCLWSRVILLTRGDEILKRAKDRINPAQPYPPELMVFFKTISWLEHDKFKNQLAAIDKGYEINALGSQIFILSGKVLAKHLWINAGFILFGLSLLLFLAAGFSYLVMY